MENNKYSDVFVFIEQRHGFIEKVSLELLSKGREIANELNSQLRAILIYSEMKNSVMELFEYGVDEIIEVKDERLKFYSTEPYTKAFSEIIEAYNPDTILIGATTIGRDLAPRVSARVNTGLTADCTTLEVDEITGNLLMTRPAFGGNIMATIICPDHRPQMSTVRPGVMQLKRVKKPTKGKITDFNVNFTDTDFDVEIIEEVLNEDFKVNIEEANVLVSIGRGLGHIDNLSIYDTLAKKLGGTISASRGAVDSGWIIRNHQVGQTGKTVRPDLYIACGISGQIQHVAGMEESGYIIAINKDETAPIFNYADLGIVGDMNKVVPELINLLES
jgi:electron transfer flavoprotein alpha subunit